MVYVPFNGTDWASDVHFNNKNLQVIIKFSSKKPKHIYISYSQTVETNIMVTKK